MANDIVTQLNEVKDQLGKPYLPQVSLPVERTSNDNLSNFFRSGPLRKTFVLNCTGGDYEYDENMTADIEIKLENDNDTVYNTATALTEQYFEKTATEFSGHQPGFSYTDYDDTSREGEYIDGVEWTPEYESGAVFGNADSTVAKYWSTNNEHIVLQKGKWSGDGNFILFVLMTVTERID